MFRYDRWLPELPSVPPVLNSSESNPCGRQFNLSDLHHLDTSRFIVSLSDVDDHWTKSGREVRRSTVRSPRVQLRRKKNSSNVKPLTSSTSSTDAAIVDLDCFRLIFVAVDVAIVAFHLCRGYIDLQRVQRCRCRGLDADIDPCGLRNGGLPMTTDPAEDRAGLGRLLPPPLPSDGLVPTACNDATMAIKTSTTTNDLLAVNDRELDVSTPCQQRSTDVLQRQRRQSHVVTRTTMTLVGRVVHSRSLLPLLACAFILAATHCVAQSCRRLSASHLALSTGTMGSVFATTVGFQTATAKVYLSEDTRHLDSAVLQLSSSSMTQDLQNLLGIVNYFRRGLNVSHLLYAQKHFRYCCNVYVSSRHAERMPEMLSLWINK